MNSALIAFITECCIANNIDESHGLGHAEDTVGWALQLLEAEVGVNEEEWRLVVAAAALHDMCDHKYVDEAVAITNIRAWLLRQDWSAEMADALIAIITTMSYSKLKKAEAENGRKVWPAHGRWTRAYHIVRHADLLDAYKPARCYLYQKHVTPRISDVDAWAVAARLFDMRVFRYVPDGWITLPRGVELATGLETEARRMFSLLGEMGAGAGAGAGAIKS